MVKKAKTDPGGNLSAYSVSEISGAIKRTVEDAFGLVRIRGEISGFRGRHSSGHAYFSLKDERARIEAVIWKGSFSKLKFLPEEGLEVIATGRITTYPGSSRYQIIIEALEPAGAGALMALLEERRRALAAEGLFDAARKRQLPFMPKVIGVVTSPTGAVIRDILHRIADRFPVHVIVWPVRVQGETSGAEVAAAINGFNALQPQSPVARPDVLIVARGGGSLEDLWGFNDEAVVRAAANSTIPLIAAVGHETDWTLIDHAADRRAPTPTGAAEMAVPVRADLAAEIAALAARLSGSISRHGADLRQTLRALVRALPSLDSLLALPRRRLDDAASSLERSLDHGVVMKRRVLERPAARLSPLVLKARVASGRQTLNALVNRLDAIAGRRLEQSRAGLNRSAAILSTFPAQAIGRLHRHGDRRAALTMRLDAALTQAGRRRRERLEATARLLVSLSYRNVLARGFAIVRDKAGTPLSSAAAIDKGARLSIEFSDGNVAALATGPATFADKGERQTDSKPDKTSKTAARSGKDVSPGQGSLF